MLILSVILYINYTTRKSLFNVSSLFTCIWSFSGAISSLGLYELYKPSNITHFYIISVIIAFNIVYFLLSKNKKSENLTSGTLMGYPKITTMVTINLISWIYVQDTLIKSVTIIFDQGFNVLRAYAFNSEMGLASSLKLFIIQNIVQAIFISTIIISVVYKSLNKPIIILTIISILDVIIYTLLFGGRSLILLLALSYIFSYLLQKKKKINFKFNHFMYACSLILIMYWITNLRSWNDDSFVKNIVLYFSGSFSYFSILIDNINLFSNDYLLGTATFGFIYNPFHMLFSFLYKIPYIGSDVIITQITAVPIYISPTQTYNAVTSFLFPFYMDFGYIGILLGTFVFTVLSVQLENKSIFSNKVVFKVMYVYILICIFDSIMTYQLLFIKTGFIFCFIILFINKNRRTMIYNE